MNDGSGSARAKPNVWVALAGAALVLALAIGLLLGGGADAQSTSAAGGYGGGSPTGNGNPPRNCSQGYQYTPCPPEVGNITNSPAKPKKGKGFKVSFTSKSGGAYTVLVVRKGKQTVLEAGNTGTGKTTTKKVGKKLKAGKYELRATINTNPRGGKPDVAKKTLKIVKP